MAMILLEHFHGVATRINPAKTAYALLAPGFNAVALFHLNVNRPPKA